MLGTHKKIYKILKMWETTHEDQNNPRFNRFAAYSVWCAGNTPTDFQPESRLWTREISKKSGDLWINEINFFISILGQ